MELTSGGIGCATRLLHREVYELNGKYGASPEEFVKILDEMNNDRMCSSARILELRFNLKGCMTAQERPTYQRYLPRHGSRNDGR